MKKLMKNIIKGNDCLFRIYKKVREFEFKYVRSFIFEIKKFYRCYIYKNNMYIKLKRFKNIHKNERCFIIATGPSLTKEDLMKLKGEITFGMNSLCLLFDEIGWETTYFGVQDTNVYEKLKERINRIDKRKVFIGDSIVKYFSLNFEGNVYPLNLLNHPVNVNNLNTKFSDDIYKVVYDGYTITYSLIQIAVYMGFKEIYLLGTDCNYNMSGKKHIVETGVVDPMANTASDRMTFAYKVAKEYVEKTNTKIYNATRGGMLEVFERVNLDDILERDL